MSMGRLARTARTAALLAAVGGGTAAALYVVQVRPREAIEQAEREAKRLFHFGRAHVVGGRLETKGATLAFAREDGGRFRLSEPVDWPADPEALGALLDRMAILRIDPVLTEAATADELRGWGLDPPAFRLHVHLRDGARHTVLIGAKNELVDKVAVSAGGRRVGLASAGFLWAFDRPFEDFRSARLSTFSADAVVGVRVLGEDGSLRVALARVDGVWRLDPDGRSVRASPSRVRTLVERMTSQLEATRFVTDRFEPSGADGRFGLDAPVATVVLEADGGRTETFRFGRLRGTSEDAGSLVAHRSGTKTVAEVDGERLWPTLIRSSEELHDTRVSRFDLNAVAEVTIRIGRAAPFTVRRQDDRWVATSRPEQRLKAWRIDAVIRAFAFLEGSAVHRAEPTAAELRAWLLEPPSRRLVFKDDEGAVLAAVRIGNRLDEDHLLAASEDDMRVIAVLERPLRSLPDRFQDLVDTSPSEPR